MDPDIILRDIFNIVNEVLRDGDEVEKEKLKRISQFIWKYNIKVKIETNVNNNSEQLYELRFEIFEGEPWNVLYLGMNKPYKYPINRNELKKDLENYIQKKRDSNY